MDNTNARVTIKINKNFVRGSDAFNTELKQQIKAVLTEMNRTYSEAEFERQITNPWLLSITMGGVDFLVT